MITSNIKSVIGRLERYQAGVPKAIARVMRPEKYLLALETAASRTLKTLAETDEEKAIIPKFLVTIHGEIFDGRGMIFSMHSPVAGNADIGAAQASVYGSLARATGAQTVSTRKAPLAMTPEQQANVMTVRDAILEWVRTEKVKDERDADRSDDEIADRLIWIMGLHPEQKFTVSLDKSEVVDIEDGRPVFETQRAYTAEMQAAGESLARVIQAWIAEGGFARAQGQALDPATAAQWLAAVLATWRGVLRERLLLGLNRELATLKAEIWGLGQGTLGV